MFVYIPPAPAGPKRSRPIIWVVCSGRPRGGMFWAPFRFYNMFWAGGSFCLLP